MNSKYKLANYFCDRCTCIQTLKLIYEWLWRNVILLHIKPDGIDLVPRNITVVALEKLNGQQFSPLVIVHVVYAMFRANSRSLLQC